MRQDTNLLKEESLVHSSGCFVSRIVKHVLHAMDVKGRRLSKGSFEKEEGLSAIKEFQKAQFLESRQDQQIKPNSRELVFPDARWSGGWGRGSE